MSEKYQSCWLGAYIVGDNMSTLIDKNCPPNKKFNAKDNFNQQFFSAFKTSFCRQLICTDVLLTALRQLS